MEEGLAKVKTLGAAEEEVDDMAAWVARSRRVEEANKRAAERAAASRVASMYDEEVRTLAFWHGISSVCHNATVPDDLDHPLHRMKVIQRMTGSQQPQTSHG